LHDECFDCERRSQAVTTLLKLFASPKATRKPRPAKARQGKEVPPVCIRRLNPHRVLIISSTSARSVSNIHPITKHLASLWSPSALRLIDAACTDALSHGTKEGLPPARAQCVALRCVHGCSVLSTFGHFKAMSSIACKPSRVNRCSRYDALAARRRIGSRASSRRH